MTAGPATPGSRTSSTTRGWSATRRPTWSYPGSIACSRTRSGGPWACTTGCARSTCRPTSTSSSFGSTAGATPPPPSTACSASASPSSPPPTGCWSSGAKGISHLGNSARDRRSRDLARRGLGGRGALRRARCSLRRRLRLVG